MDLLREKRKLLPLGNPQDSGGGGGGGTSNQTSTTDLPEWARPYAKDILSKGAALTDINKNPYQQYGAERIAGFQPLQEQAFKTVGGMDAGPQGFQQNVGSYMSPYVQNVVDIQKQEAGRQSAMLGQQQAAGAVQRGAFGGSRDALMRSERERNLAQQMGEIQARGSQAAYEQAANQFRQGITQQSGLAQLQGTLGAQQQQQAQRPLDVAYQDFLNQQNYPYKQLGFMSDLLKGTPTGSSSTVHMYDPGPSLAQSLGGIGLGAYGLSKAGLFAEGGQIEDRAPVVSYADGGVTDPNNVENIISKLSDQQLRAAREAAMNRRDIQQLQMIDTELAERASLRGGLGNAFNQIPPEQQEEMMAGGGIVAFAKGGGAYESAFLSSLSDLKSMANDAPAVQTAEQYEEGITKRIPGLEKLYGEDITKPYLEETKAKRAALPEQMEKDTGLAITAAAMKLLGGKGANQKTKLIQGISDAGETFVSEVGKIKRENREVDDKLRQSEILLATAQQSRKEGLVNKAAAQEDRAQDLARDAYKTKIGIQEKVAQLNSGLAQTELQGKNAKEVAGIHAAVQREVANKPGEFERMLSDYEKRLGRKLTPKEYKEAMAEIGAARYGAKYTGPDTTFANDAKFQKDLSDRTKMLMLQKSMPGKTQAEVDAIDSQIEAERLKLIEEYKQTRASGITSKPPPGAAAPAAAPAATQSPLYVTAPDGKTYKFKTQAEADKFRQQIGG